jgi:hypothetical protein
LGNDRELRQLVAERKQRTSSHEEVFVCKCGEVIADPFDPKMIELHGPHFVAASLERMHEALERHRAYYARRTME